MSGTPAGAKKAVAKIKAKDPDFFRKIGAKGGRNGNTGGFAKAPWETYAEHHKRVSAAGSLGGSISKRSKKAEGR